MIEVDVPGWGRRQIEHLVMDYNGCLGLDGKPVWSSGPAHRFGLGSYIIADGIIYVTDDEGVLTMVEATSEGYHQLDRAKVLPGPDSWGPMALAGGRLIARDLRRMVCLDVRER